MRRQYKPTDDGWRDRAACAGQDINPDWFFPDATAAIERWTHEPDDTDPVDHRRGPARIDTSTAEAVCGVCPVANDCLADALATPPADDLWGIRNGTTPTQRNRIRKRIGSNVA